MTRAVARPLVVFYLLAFGVSWLGWIPSVLGSHGVAGFAHPAWRIAVVLPAVGPALAAIVATFVTGGRSWSAAFRPETRAARRRDARWFLVALGLPLALLVAANGLAALSPGARAASPPLQSTGLALFVVVSLIANPMEERGWRGFALPRLMDRLGFARACLIVGVLAALWHLPIFLRSSGTIAMAAVPFWPWAAGSVANAFVVGWLFERSGRSVPVAATHHVARNLAGAVLGIESWVAMAIVDGAAAIVAIAAASAFERRDRAASRRSAGIDRVAR